MQPTSQSCRARGAILIAVLTLALESGVGGAAQIVDRASTLSEAAALASRGDYMIAIAAYDRLLQSNPKDREALTGRGYVRAWQKHYAEAIGDFKRALEIDQNNVAARNGLGYALAWSGQYAEAEQAFQQVLRGSLADLDAGKGLAYVALWRGDSGEAARRFRELSTRNPSNAEVHVGLGQALYAEGALSEARVAFERALVRDPGNADARRGLDASTAPSFKTSYDVAFFVSQTHGGGEGKEGLRFAQLAVQLRPDFRAWIQYDKGLGLDNADLARRNIAAEAYYVGGIYSYGGLYATRLEIGRRNLPNEVRQDIIRGEQVFFLKNGVTPKVGAWIGRRNDDRTEYIAHIGINVPITEEFRLEPTVFYSESGVGSEREVRGLLAGEYSFPAGYRIGAGFSGGHKSHAQVANSSSEVFVTFSAPISKAVRLNGLVRHQSGGGIPSLNVYAVGLALSF